MVPNPRSTVIPNAATDNGGSYDLCVIGGLGHIGLPLALLFADSGLNVICYDTDEDAAATVLAGRMPFHEDGAPDILQRVLGERLFVTTTADCIPRSQHLLVVIGTPVDEHLNPSFTVFKRCFDELFDELRPHHHVILCSTVVPGTTHKISRHLASRGKPIPICFCPERVAQGKAIHEHRTMPQIISAFDESSFQTAEALFGRIAPETLRLDPLSAELAKLFTNSWRYIQFAIANQFYNIATEQGVEFDRILQAIRYKYPRAQSLPGAGFAAGPCLLKDTMQIAAFSNNRFFLGHTAMLINEGLPNFLVQQLKIHYPLGQWTVGILGMAFKPNIDDIRESLSYKLRKILEIEAAEVLCCDPWVNEPWFVTAEQLVERCDAIVVAAPHREFLDLRIPGKTVLVDPWNAFGQGTLFHDGPGRSP